MGRHSKAGAPLDADGFAALLDAQYDSIFAFAYRALGNRQDAEDLTQDVCLSLPRRLQGWRGQSSLTTWLYRIVANAAIDRMRRRALEARTAPQWADLHMAERANDAARADRHGWLQNALTTLPEDLRITAALLVDEGMSQAAAAEILDIKPGTVAWRMSEIKRLLRIAAQAEDMTDAQ